MPILPKLLVIAGSDSGAGAGIQADLKTASALHCYATTVITAVTAQNTLGVQTVFSLSAELVIQQAEAVYHDIGADAIKIGMLGNLSIVTAVANCLLTWLKARKEAGKEKIPIVLDPVFKSSSGHNLLDDSAMAALQKKLFPIVDVLTPNSLEASILLSTGPITRFWQAREAARSLCEQGLPAVYLKGGHLEEKECLDVLCFKSKEGKICEMNFAASRIENKEFHGTGCTLSSAIAAYLAHGESLPSACQHAKEYVTQAIARAAQGSGQIGKGALALHHF